MASTPNPIFPVYNLKNNTSRPLWSHSPQSVVFFSLQSLIKKGHFTSCGCFYSNFTIFFRSVPKKKLVFTVVVKRCVCVSELVSEKRGVSASANQRATPRALANQRLLSAARERRVCFWASHVQSCYSRSTNTFFSRSILTTPPESPTFDLGELENTDLDMNRLFFILLANRPARLVLFRQLLFIAVITQNQRSFSSSGSSRASSICSVIIS